MTTQTNKEPVDVKILVAIPSTDNWSAQFGMSLAMMMFHLAQFPVLPNVRKQQVVLLNRRSSMLGQSRDSLFEEAFDHKCTHILWLDSDMRFPDNTIHWLMQHNRTFVGANYVRKTIPSAPVTAAIGGGLTYTDECSTGLEEVLHIGFGVCLMRLEDLKDIPAPRFMQEWNEELHAYSGEDVYFCSLLRERGIPIYVDHDLSQKVQHIGTFNFDHTVVGDIITAQVDAEEKRQQILEESNRG